MSIRHSVAKTCQGLLLAILLALATTHSALAQSPGPDDLNVAKQMLEDGFYQEAQQILREYVEEHTEDSYALHLLGVAKFGMENYKEALRWFLISASKDHDDEISNHNHEYMARCYELLGDLRNALRYYRKFAAQHPQSISTWHSKASIANELGDYLDAIDYLESIPDDYEHHQLVLLERTKAHYHLGNYDLAILYGNRVQVDAVELNDAINLHYYLVNAAIAEEDFGFAFDMVVELEKLEPGPSRDIMTQYVMLAINTDNQDEGLQKGLEFCREFEPDKTIYPFLSQYLDSNFNQLELHWFEEFATCSQEFSHLYQRKLYNEGKYQEYARRYDSLEEVNPYLHLLMVRSLHKLGKPHEALSHIGQALDSYREPQDLYPFYAMEYTIRHEEDMPVLDISRQLYENFPSDEALYNYLTDLYQSREFDEFFDVLETYDYHGEERYLIMYMAGNSALEIEEYEQAIAYYLQVQPENSTMRLNTYHRIAYAYDMLEDDLNALEYYRQALEHADSSRAAINIERRITHLEQQVSPENTTEN